MDVMSRISCSTEKMPRLALCRVPRKEAEHFAADVHKISNYVGCDAGQLANVLREFQAITAMRRYDPDVSHHETMLMAARDKKSEYDKDGGDSE